MLQVMLMNEYLVRQIIPIQDRTSFATSNSTQISPIQVSLLN